LFLEDPVDLRFTEKEVHAAFDIDLSTCDSLTTEEDFVSDLHSDRNVNTGVIDTIAYSLDGSSLSRT
jgi:hypothetical protein